MLLIWKLKTFSSMMINDFALWTILFLRITFELLSLKIPKNPHIPGLSETHPPFCFHPSILYEFSFCSLINQRSNYWLTTFLIMISSEPVTYSLDFLFDLQLVFSFPFLIKCYLTFLTLGSCSTALYTLTCIQNHKASVSLSGTVS